MREKKCFKKKILQFRDREGEDLNMFIEFIYVIQAVFVQVEFNGKY